MKRTILSLSFLCLLVACGRAPKVDLEQTASAVADRALSYTDPRHYAGTVYTQALAELYKTTGCEPWLARTCAILDRFQSGEWQGYGSFISYKVGGTAAPEMVRYGFEAYRTMALAAADSMFTHQPRNADGIMLPPWPAAIEKNGVFMDPVFAVTPYLLYAGIVAENQDWIDYAAWMTLRTFSDLADTTSGLAHQARGINRMLPGQLTDDCWSRGNGWGAMALGALMRDLPRDNRYYGQVCDLARRYFAAVLKYQDEAGLWHQEMTWPGSFTEISGSALLLYGLGSGIESGVLPAAWRKPFKKGIAGLLRYIDARGNVANTCSGCLAYKDGSKEAYASHAYFCNEQHAFGPALLALGQALRLGIRRVRSELGAEMRETTPECVVFCAEDRKADVAWENDRAAYRIYSRQVKHKVSSGVDYWAKRVDYPILRRWYAKDAAGGSYHEDDGEGCDFYAVGKHRGVGGIGLWVADSLVVPEPYESFVIDYCTPDSLRFTVVYPAIEIPQDSVVLTETISMKQGSYYYRACVTARTASGRGVTLAAGLTAFGAPEIRRSEAHASLNLIETVESIGEKVGSSLVAEKACFRGFATFGSDELVLLDLPAGASAQFFAGAAWSRDSRFDPFYRRWVRITNEATFDTISTK